MVDCKFRNQCYPINSPWLCIITWTQKYVAKKIKILQLTQNMMWSSLIKIYGYAQWILNTGMSLNLENRQRLPIFDGCSRNIVFFVALPGAQLRFEWSLHVYNFFHFAKCEEVFKKMDDKNYLFLAFLHQFCETYSTEQLETSQYSVEHFFGSDQYKRLQNIRGDCLPRPNN